MNPHLTRTEILAQERIVPLYKSVLSLLIAAIKTGSITLVSMCMNMCTGDSNYDTEKENNGGSNHTKDVRKDKRDDRGRPTSKLSYALKLSPEVMQ